MTNYQIAKRNMFKKVLDFFAVPANAAIWVAFTRLVDEIANYVSLYGDLDAAVEAQAKETQGITTGKGLAFNNMVETAVTMAYKGFVWATDANNTDLAHVFDVQVSDFEKMPGAVALTKVKAIRTGISDNIASMAGVNLLPADVTNLNNLILAYENVMQKPEETIASKESGTDAIVTLFHDIDSSLGLISRLIIAQYSTTNPTLVSDFKNNKHIDDLPTHHSGIHTHITDALTGADIEGAVLSIPAAGKSATSNINGIAEIIKIKNGDYHVNVTFPGYQSQSFKTKIIRGKITSFEIKLSTASGGGGVTAIREGDVTSPGTANIDVEGIKATPLTQLIILVAGSALRFYASATPGGVPGPEDPFIDVQPGTHYQKQLDEFIALIGLNETKKYLTVQNIGMTTGHYHITFDNLEA